MNTTANVIGGYKGKFHCQSCSKTVFSTQLMQTKQLIQRPSSVSIASSVAYTYIYIDGAPPSKQNQNICLPLHLAIRQTAYTHHTLKCARARSLSLSFTLLPPPPASYHHTTCDSRAFRQHFDVSSPSHIIMHSNQNVVVRAAAAAYGNTVS